MWVRLKPSQADDSAMTEPTEIRQPVAMRIYLLLFSLLFIGTVLVPHGVGSGSDVVLVPVFLVVSVAFFGRIASLRVLADESGLHVRNFLRTQHFQWDEVEDFRLGRPMMSLPFGWVIHALLRNGEVATLDITANRWGFGSGGRQKREEMLRRLRGWLPSGD
jgi:hypothetical protein